MPREPRRQQPSRGRKPRINPLALLPPEEQERILVTTSDFTKDLMKRIGGIPLGAVFAHGLGMHNPQNGMDCHPDPECPTCRRERRR